MFTDVRPQLLGIAFRVLGTRGDAEDIVQDTWIRWQNCDRSKVRDASAFLATTAARLSSNAVQSARARRETNMALTQQDPVDTSASPELAAERGEALGFALRLTLEKLSPSERAAFVLRHAFDYPYERIAEIVHQTQASVRQHVSRARKRLTVGESAAINSSKYQQLVDAFVAGAQMGDLDALERLFAADVINGGRQNASMRSLATPPHTNPVRNRRRRNQTDAFATKTHEPPLHVSARKLVTFGSRRAPSPPLDSYSYAHVKSSR
jgi:RNA polymerase sigma-70 factor (ECF subfamily)